MPKIEISNAKGLVQKTGTGVVATPLDQDVAQAGTIDTSCFYTRVTPGGARTDVKLEAGTVDGQLVLISNVGGTGHDITFHATTSNFILNNVTLEDGESMLCVWNGTKWTPTSQSLS